MFEKITKDRNYDLFWGPKWPKNWSSEAHILHTSKSTCNEHVKQYFWGNIVVHIQAKYRKDRVKTEGAYSI